MTEARGTSPAHIRRRTPLSAYGAPGVWLLAFALVLALAMITLLLGSIATRGLATFWPAPVDLIEMRGGERFMGMPVREANYRPAPEEAEALRALRAGGGAVAGSFDEEGRPVRRLYRVGNRDLGSASFRWVALPEVASVERPSWAAVFERREWGVFVGRAEALMLDGRVAVSGGRNAREALPSWMADARERLARIDHLREDGLAPLDRSLERLRLRVRSAELRASEAGDAPRGSAGARWGAWIGLIAFAAGVGVAGRRLGAGGRGRRALGVGAWCVMGLALVGVVGERPWTGGAPTSAEVEALRAEVSAERSQLEREYERLLAEIRAVRDEDARYRVVLRDAEGRMAPESTTNPDEPMRVSQLVRMVTPNEAGMGGKVSVYLSRWKEFLTEAPRASNTEGGIWPVIFGTVVLTILLAVAVAPLGVVAAVYLREYARQGLVTSVVRIAVNNLAGVPSIVYGVFGLGFFCYTVGRYVDEGPREPLPALPWWFILGGGALAVWTAVSLGIAARPRPGSASTRGQRAAGWVVGLSWLGAVALLGLAVATTPYFDGFFRVRASEGSPTFGTRGILWASLTLALLTLPVVIVATEEAISAVPRSMREGSFGCGASRWQTIRRIVLPGAAPGILTGMILAMARGAGEVAPLMLVGAVKVAPELPVSGEWPFIHAERSFMHLGFHIYDLGFQSPDAQAAEGLVWSATLVLVGIVFVLNLSAFVLRGRLRSRLRTGAV